MTDAPCWELVVTDVNGLPTERLRVPNGWLYWRGTLGGDTMAFVPDAVASTRQFTSEFNEQES